MLFSLFTPNEYYLILSFNIQDNILYKDKTGVIFVFTNHKKNFKMTVQTANRNTNQHYSNHKGTRFPSDDCGEDKYSTTNKFDPQQQKVHQF